MTIREYIENVTVKPQADYVPLDEGDNINTLFDYMGMVYGVFDFIPWCDTVEKITAYINTIFKVNAYKYNTLYRSMTQEYNPIQNYDMVEKENINASGEKSSTQSLGKEHSKSETKDSSTLSDTGNTTESSSGGDTVTHSVAPYDSTDTLYTESQDKTTTDGKEVKTTLDTSHTTDGTSSTEVTSDERTNTTSDSSKDDTERTLTRSGNIGVTTSQQMLQSERDIANFTFLGIVAQDIVEKLCIRIF